MTETRKHKTWTRPEVEAEVIAAIVEAGKVDAERVTPDATIVSLEIESIDFIMILDGLERRFDLYMPVDQEIADLTTVSDLIEEIHRHLGGTKDFEKSCLVQTREKKIWTRREVEAEVIATIIEEGKVDAEKVSPDATIESLTIEPIELVMILDGLERRFDQYIPVDPDVADMTTVNYLIDEIYRHVGGTKDAEN